MLTPHEITLACDDTLFHSVGRYYFVFANMLSPPVGIVLQSVTFNSHTTAHHDRA